MTVKQISVFLENSEGTLCNLVKTLGDAGINILALTVADTTDFGIVRMILKSEDTDKAVALLVDAGDMARSGTVVCLKIPHRPGGFAHALSLLEAGGVAVEYSYSFCRNATDDAVIILRTSDDEKTAQIFSDAGITMLSQSEIDKF